MGLLTFIQIPCHHVLANEIALNLKYRIGLKHIFNINLGIGIIKKLLFLFVFLTYLLVFLLKFQSGVLVGCRIKFRIQWVPTLHTFDGPCYPKNKKCLKKCDGRHHVFLGISCFWDSEVHQKYVEWVLIGCRIKFRIQRVPTRHTFDGPHYPKNKKYLKKGNDVGCGI